MAEPPYLFNLKIKIMRPIQELHKADAVWFNANKYYRQEKGLQEFQNWVNIGGTDDESSRDAKVTIDFGSDCRHDLCDVPLSVVNELIEMLKNYKRSMTYSAINMLAELGYQYDPFNEENQ